MARPKAARTVKRNQVGDLVNYGDEIGNGAYEVTGVVIYADSGFTQFPHLEVSGVVNIVRLHTGTAGRDYAVTVDGKLVYVSGIPSTFPSLAEAATWAGV